MTTFNQTLTLLKATGKWVGTCAWGCCYNGAIIVILLPHIAYNYGNQTGNYGQYNQGTYGYDRYSAGQQAAAGGDTRTDYGTGYNYSKS